MQLLYMTLMSNARILKMYRNMSYKLITTKYEAKKNKDDTLTYTTMPFD